MPDLLAPLGGWRAALVGAAGPRSYKSDDGEISTAHVRLVGIVVSLFADEYGARPFPTGVELVRATGLSRTMVDRALDALFATGWLTRQDDVIFPTTPGLGTETPVKGELGETGRAKVLPQTPSPNEYEGSQDQTSYPSGVGSSRGSGKVNKSADFRDEQAVPSPQPGDKPGENFAAAKRAFVDVWTRNAPPLIGHSRPYYETNRFTLRLRSALSVYELEEIVKAVENYAEVLRRPAEFYWKHRFPAEEFLWRERAQPGVARFVDSAVPFENFRHKRDRDTDREGTTMRSPADKLASAEAWVLATAWKLPLDEAEIAEELGRRGVEGPDRARLVELWRSKRPA
jgi:hypothetical protein